MKAIFYTAIFSASIVSCSSAVLTGETKVPLELKGYRIGQEISSCPDKRLGKLEGRVLSCVLNEKSLGDTEVVSAGLSAIDGKVVLIKFNLSQASGFSQPAAVRALIQKFGQPTHGSRSSIYIWRNNYSGFSGTGVQLQIDEIKGEVVLMSVEGLAALQNERARMGSKDL